MDKQPQVESKVDNINAIYSPENQIASNLTRMELRMMVSQEPMMLKAIRKKSRDMFREGWTIASEKPDMPVEDAVLDIINEFNKNADVQAKLEKLRIDGGIYGDGIAEIIYVEPKKMTSEDPVFEKAEPADLKVLNVEYVQDIETKNKIDYYMFWKMGGVKQYIHPDRILHYPHNAMAYSKFGISDVFTASNIIKSKKTLDLASGDFVDWCGRGKLDINIKSEANEQHLKDLAKAMDKPRNVYVHTDKYEYKTLAQSAMAIKEYSDYFTMNIAAVGGVPTHILQGIQPGQLTGSELGFVDYQHEIENEQRIFGNLLKALYTRLLRSHGYEWTYNILWNEGYADEQSESIIFKTKAEAAVMLVDRFIITPEEARVIIVKGIIDDQGKPTIEPEDIPEEPEPIPAPEIPQEPPTNPTQEIRHLTDEELAMIKKQKEQNLKEIIAQEERLAEAEELLKTSRKVSKNAIKDKVIQDAKEKDNAL
jgi:hypothetical protein